MHIRLKITAALLASCCGAALAQSAVQALPRNGSCPTGYSSSGDYCVPGSNARHAIERVGSCPSGYSSNGNYCVASSNNSKTAIHRNGSCPSGYSSSGNYCVQIR